MDYWYYRSHDDSPGKNINMQTRPKSYYYLSRNPNRFHLLDSDNQKINSSKGNENGNQDTYDDATGEEDASDEVDSRPDETNQNVVDDNLDGNHGNDHIHHHGKDHHTGETDDDGTHPATEGTYLDLRGEMVWNNVEDIEEDALKSYDDDSYYETHELDEHQETREYSEESREGEYKYFLSYLIRPNLKN